MTMIEITQDDIAAALSHLGFDSIADLHYWAFDNNELNRFDALVQILAQHRITARAQAGDVPSLAAKKLDFNAIEVAIAEGLIMELDMDDDNDSLRIEQVSTAIAKRVHQALGDEA